MKLVQSGINVAGWFVGKTGACWKCAAIVAFGTEDADKAQIDTSYQGDGDRYLKWQCPECGADNSLSGPSGAAVSKLIYERRVSIQ